MKSSSRREGGDSGIPVAAAAAAGGAGIAAAKDAAEARLPLARRPPGRFLSGAAAALVFAFPPGRRAQPGGEDSGKWLRRKGRGVCLRGERWSAAPLTGRRPSPAGCLGVGPKPSFDLGPAERGRWRRLVLVLLPRLRPVALARPGKDSGGFGRALLRAVGSLCHGEAVGRWPPSSGSGRAALLEAAGHCLLKCFC